MLRRGSPPDGRPQTPGLPEPCPWPATLLPHQGPVCSHSDLRTSSKTLGRGFRSCPTHKEATMTHPSPDTCFFLGGGGGRCVPLTCSHSKAVQNMGSGHRQGPDIGDSSWNLPQDADPPPPTPWPFLRERLCSPCREAQVRAEPLRGLPGGPHPELHPPSSRFCVSYQLSNNGEPLLPHVSSAGMRRWGDGCLRGGGRRRAAAAKGSSEGRRF